MISRHERRTADIHTGIESGMRAILAPLLGCALLFVLLLAGCSETAMTAPTGSGTSHTSADGSTDGDTPSDDSDGEGSGSTDGGSGAGTDGATDGASDQTSPVVAECASPDVGWIWCDDFEENRLGEYFEYSDQGGSFQLVEGVGTEGSAGMRARFSAGQVSAGGLRLAFGRTPQSYFAPVDEGTAHYREIYWRVYLRHQDGWIGGGGDKLSRATVLADENSWAQSMIAHVWSGSGDTRNVLALDPASGTDEAGNLITDRYNDFANLRWLGARYGSTPIFSQSRVGEWYCIEAHVRLNQPGASDGVFELWIDEAPEVWIDDLNFSGAFTDYALNAVFLENYWNAGSPQAQERYFDRFVVSTRRIGC